jgi:hypothetical protein
MPKINDMNRRKEFREIMAVMFLAYRKPLDSEATDIYYRFLKNNPMDKIKKAVADIVTTSRHFPSIAEIMEAMVEDEASEVEIRADILNAISEYGIYNNPRFKYQISGAVADDLGWQAMCKMERKDLNDMIHFRYDSILQTWRECQKKGLPFKLPGVKGIFGEHGKSKFRPIGDLLSEHKPPGENS